MNDMHTRHLEWLHGCEGVGVREVEIDGWKDGWIALTFPSPPTEMALKVQI